MPQRNARRKNTAPSMLPIILIAAGVLLVIGALVWRALSAQSTAQTSPTSAQQGSIPFPEVQRVSLADAKTALDQKTALIVDVRDEASYATSHITGSINIPLEDLETRLTELDPNQWIIFYCT